MRVKKGINQFVLKIIAILSMTIDHFAAVMYVSDFNLFSNHPELYTIMRSIGRIAMPIYVFLIVNGFFYTRNVKKYILRLFLFGIATEVIFDLAFFNSFFYWDHNNVMFTFALGVFMLFVLEHLQHEKYLSIVVPFLFCAAAYFLNVDYNVFGMIAIYLFYCFHKRTESAPEQKKEEKRIQNIVAANFLSFFFEISIGYGIVYLSTIPMIFYNGKQGPRMKYFFYAYYPLHLLVLYLIRQFLIGGF